MTKEEIVGQGFIVLIAGYETTATTLQYLTYNLTMNPDVQEKVFDEIRDTLGDVGLLLLLSILLLSLKALSAIGTLISSFTAILLLLLLLPAHSSFLLIHWDELECHLPPPLSYTQHPKATVHTELQTPPPPPAPPDQYCFVVKFLRH